MAAIKAKIAPSGSEVKMVRAINRCEKYYKEAYPQVLWLFFEADVTDS